MTAATHVYLRQDAFHAEVNTWLATAFAPARSSDTIDQNMAGQQVHVDRTAAQAATAKIEDATVPAHMAGPTASSACGSPTPRKESRASDSKPKTRGYWQMVGVRGRTRHLRTCPRSLANWSGRQRGEPGGQYRGSRAHGRGPDHCGLAILLITAYKLLMRQVRRASCASAPGRSRSSARGATTTVPRTAALGPRHRPPVRPSCAVGPTGQAIGSGGRAECIGECRLPSWSAAATCIAVTIGVASPTVAGTRGSSLAIGAPAPPEHGIRNATAARQRTSVS